MKNIILLLLVAVVAMAARSQNYDYKFRLQLTDKGDSGHSITEPQDFLSQRALERRARQNIAVTETDLPICAEYIAAINALPNCRVVASSKWLETITVNCEDSAQVETLKTLPFVQSATFVWKGEPDDHVKNAVFKKKFQNDRKFDTQYGQAYTQLSLNNAQALHLHGYKGAGMQIAVIDAGYNNFPNVTKLSNVTVLGAKNFVDDYPNRLYTASEHGLSVLSTMAANLPGQFVGTAPEAEYYLLRSEDTSTEFPVEEDYWVAAAEYADSVGADLINTSLGYHDFDAPATDYTHATIDGNTAFITRGAEKAFATGMIVVVAAGNERYSNWGKITPPSDAANVLATGAVRSDSTFTYFSSYGPSADGRVKPDVMAMGQSVTVIRQNDIISTGDGTSFASPVMCGMVACLWQALPYKTNLEIIDIVRQSSNLYSTPNNDYGYGLPDMKLAMEIGGLTVGKLNVATIPSRSFNITAASNGTLVVTDNARTGETYDLKLYSTQGKTVYNSSFSTQTDIQTNLPQNVYIVSIQGKNVNETARVIF